MVSTGFKEIRSPGYCERIIEILATSPEVSRKDIAGIMGIAGPSVSWHTKG